MGGKVEDRTAEQLFDGFPEGYMLYLAVERAVRDIGGASIKVTKSQVAFRRRRGFAFVWRPGQYVRSEIPAVLSIALPRELASTRFKSVVHPSPRLWLHHLELREIAQIDDEVRRWLTEAYADAG